MLAHSLSVTIDSLEVFGIFLVLYSATETLDTIERFDNERSTGWSDTLVTARTPASIGDRRRVFRTANRRDFFASEESLWAQSCGGPVRRGRAGPQ